MLLEPLPRSVLVVTAHPDDVDFGAAGTIATWTDQGVAVSYCIVTDGDAGGFDPLVPRNEIAGIRREEQTKAAAIVGVHELSFLGYPDGLLESTLALRRDIARVIRMVKPDRVLCQSSQRDYSRIFASHPDHLAAGEATLCAVYPDARNPFIFTELLAEGHEPHSVSEVWVMGGGSGGEAVSVDTTTMFERKISALLEHVSQHQNPDGMTERIRSWGEANAKAAGLVEGRLAETFMRIRTS